MDINTYLNLNSSNQRRSRTLQPIRTSSDKDFLLERYLKSQMERDNYANAEVIHPHEPFAPKPRNTARPPNISFHHSRPSFYQHQHQHQHLHSRSQSQHHYHTMHQGDMTYYNAAAMPRIMQSVPINEPPPTIHKQQLDTITMMQVCNEFGNLDSSPQLPGPRNYSIIRTQGCLQKVGFPQTRTLKKRFHDPLKGVFIEKGDPVSVLGPSKDDRSKFTICHYDNHIDIPHQLTNQPSLF